MSSAKKSILLQSTDDLSNNNSSVTSEQGNVNNEEIAKNTGKKKNEINKHMYTLFYSLMHGSININTNYNKYVPTINIPVLFNMDLIKYKY